MHVQGDLLKFKQSIRMEKKGDLNENSVIIYSPSISSKPVWMSLFYWTQRKICWRMWETEQFWGTIDPHSIFFPTMEVNGAPKQVTNFLSKYLPLCSAEKRHSYRFGNYLSVSQLWQNFHFWVNYPFKFGLKNGLKEIKYPEIWTEVLWVKVPEFRGKWPNWIEQKVAWSDGSQFLLGHSDGRVRIWCKQHKSMNPSCTISTVQTAGVDVTGWGIIYLHT